MCVTVPGAAQVGGQRVVVIQQQDMFGKDPVTTTCPHCQANVSHRTQLRFVSEQ